MPALERTHPAWWLLEEIEASGMIPAAELAADRRDFLRWWGEVTGGGILCGRREVGVRGLPTGEAAGRPVWIHVGPDGATRDLAEGTGLPPPECPEPVLISPIPAYTAEPERQWRGAHLWNRWPFVTIDIDRKDVEKAGTTVDAVLDRIRPLPSLVVRSGGEQGGAHVWIALSEFLPLEQALEWNRRLADLHCGDPMQARSRPSLRLPGSCNVKWHLDLELPPRLCRIDRARTDLTRRYSPADLERSIPVPHRWRPPAKPPARDTTDCPPWIAELLRGAGCEEWQVTRRFLRGQERTVIVPDKCPVCGHRGTAWVYVDEEDPRLGCHRRSCEGWASLRTVAAANGIEIAGDEDRPLHDAFRPARLEAALEPPASKTYHAGAREDEQAAIDAAAREAWLHAQTADPKRVLWVVESSTGIGKDYAVMRAIEATTGASRWDIYGKSQKHLHDKAEEWPSADRKLRLHVSPLSLVGSNGERCQKRGLMAANVQKGWEATRVCLSAGPKRKATDGGGREPCEFFEECKVRDGTREMGGAREPLVDLYTTRRLEAVGPVEKDRPAWIDESFRLVYSQAVSTDELRRFSLGSDVHPEYRHLACALLATSERLPIHGVYPVEPAPDTWDPAFRRALKPDLPARTVRPDGERPSYPKWCYELCRAAWFLARGDDRHGVLWFTRGDEAGSATWTLWRRTLDRLPRASIWTNATFWLWSDIVQAAPGLEVRRVGHRLEPRYLRRIHVPYEQASRGTDDTPRLLARGPDGQGQVANAEHESVIKGAVSTARLRWAEDTGRDPSEARVLIATYKAICERGFGAGPADFLARTGATAVDYYERLVGTNEFAGWEAIVLLGTPYPRLVEEDAAVSRLYTASAASIAERVAHDTIEQAIGRLRAVNASESQVAVAVTARAPLAWGDSTQTEIDPNRVWVECALALGVISDRIMRLVIGVSDRSLAKALEIQGLREIQQPHMIYVITGCRLCQRGTVKAGFAKHIASIAGMKPLCKKVNGPRSFVKDHFHLSEVIQTLEIAFWDTKEARKTSPDKRVECMWEELRTTDPSNMRSVLDKWVRVATHKGQ